MFDAGLTKGDSINNAQLRDIFGCGLQGGMRRSHKTGTLVIVSDKTRGIYDDRWEDDILHYTGMGQSGHQQLDAAQNKTLAESGSNDVSVHLFEVTVPKQYVYQGRVKLAGEPYTEQQPDVDNLLRDVWVFPLSFEDGGVVTPPNFDDLKTQLERQEREASRLSTAQLLQQIKSNNNPANSRTVTTNQHARDARISALVKRLAAGNCHLCGEGAPFNNKKGEPYLEAHHIKWLAMGGEDSLNNTVALCPNCHRRMHILDLAADRKRLVLIASHHEDQAKA